MFAPPSKSCRFSHPPSPCAGSMAQGVSLSADSDSGGSSPPENLPPAALSWSSLFGATVLKSICPCTMLLVLVGTGCAMSADFTAIKPHVTARFSLILPPPRDRIKGLPCEKAGAIVDLYNKLWYNIYNHHIQSSGAPEKICTGEFWHADAI